MGVLGSVSFSDGIRTQRVKTLLEFKEQRISGRIQDAWVIERYTADVLFLLDQHKWFCLGLVSPHEKRHRT